MNELTIIERGGKRVLTTQQLAEAYETDEKVITRNFQRNRERYQEGKHYFSLTGQALQEFKGSRQNDVTLKYVSVIYLWTEAGALHHAKSLGTDKAWDVFEDLEETYFRVKDDMQQLSPQLQLLINMELEQKKLRQQLNEVNYNALTAKAAAEKAKDEVQAIRDVIVINPQAEWRKRTNKILNEIGLRLNGNYKHVKDEVYEALKQRGNCRPNILVNNLKSRALMNGMARSKADELNILDVLENEPRLREIYVTIVKEMAIKNGVWIREGQA